MTDDRTPLSPFATDPDEELYAEINRLNASTEIYKSLVQANSAAAEFWKQLLEKAIAENTRLKQELDTLRNLKHPAY
jgi:hypothetical protein